MDADDVPVLERPHLHEVAELVRQPESPPARLVEHGLAPAGERRVDLAPVLDLEEEEAAVVPGANDPEPPPWRMLFVAISFTARTSASVVSRSSPACSARLGDEVPDRAERVGVER